MRGLGSPALKEAGRKKFNLLGLDAQINICKAHHHFKSLKNDWILPFVTQDFEKFESADISDSLYYLSFCQMLQDNNIFMLLMKADSFAELDENIEHNSKLLSKIADNYNIEFNIKSSPQGEDGFITLLESKKFKRLILDDSKMPLKLDEIVIDAGTVFPLEIGTNSISKFVQYLQIEKAIARLPYKSNEAQIPYLAFFINRNQL